ncbi:MAG TPA: hypothetical protein VGG20_25180 [Thermoanaerobaculia bacterium]|jgi:hypothetical protein
MAKTSIAEAIVAWEKALLNVKATASDAPGVAGYAAPLEKILDDAKNLSASLEGRKAMKQQESLDRAALMKLGNKQVSRIRLALKAFFGPDSERIIEYGGRPVRARKSKPKTSPPASTPPPSTAPGTTATHAAAEPAVPAAAAAPTPTSTPTPPPATAGNS